MTAFSRVSVTLLIILLGISSSQNAGAKPRWPRILCATVLATAALPAVGVVVGPWVYDYRLNSAEGSAEREMDALAKHISQKLKLDLRSRSWAKQRALLHQRMKDNPFISLYGAGLDSIFVKKEDHFIPMAFIPPGLTPSGPNIYAAYLRMAEEYDMLAWRDGSVMVMPETYPDPNYDFTKLTEEELVLLATGYLPKVETPSISDMAVGIIIEHPNGSSGPATSALWKLGGDQREGESAEARDHRELVLQGYANKLCHLATPLFLAVLERPDNSISQREFFDMALDIYKDAWTALGMIGFLTGYDVYSVDRYRASIVGVKLKRILPETDDRSGNLYHFWNYLIRAVYYGGTFTDNRLSWGYEMVSQSDRSDRLADKFGMRTGNIILEELD